MSSLDVVVALLLHEILMDGLNFLIHLYKIIHSRVEQLYRFCHANLPPLTTQGQQQKILRLEDFVQEGIESRPTWPSATYTNKNKKAIISNQPTRSICFCSFQQHFFKEQLFKTPLFSRCNYFKHQFFKRALKNKICTKLALN